MLFLRRKVVPPEASDERNRSSSDVISRDGHYPELSPLLKGHSAPLTKATTNIKCPRCRYYTRVFVVYVVVIMHRAALNLILH